MGQRIYSTFFDNVTISAVQDVFLLKAGSVNGIELHQIDLSAGGVTAPAEIRLRLRRLPATVTNGSGGSAPTIGVTDSGDTKATTATVRANDTTQATTGGTAVTLQAHQWNVLLPWQYLPAPEDREVIQAAEALVLDIPAAPASTVVSGTIKWREIP
jgi:hypothetical protein